MTGASSLYLQGFVQNSKSSEPSSPDQSSIPNIIAEIQKLNQDIQSWMKNAPHVNRNEFLSSLNKAASNTARIEELTNQLNAQYLAKKPSQNPVNKKTHSSQASIASTRISPSISSTSSFNPSSAVSKPSTPTSSPSIDSFLSPVEDDEADAILREMEELVNQDASPMVVIEQNPALNLKKWDPNIEAFKVGNKTSNPVQTTQLPAEEYSFETYDISPGIDYQVELVNRTVDR